MHESHYNIIMCVSRLKVVLMSAAEKEMMDSYLDFLYLLKSLKRYDDDA